MTQENKFQNTTGEGFFKEYFLNIKNAITEEQLQSFESLKSDDDRVRFARKLIASDKSLVVNSLQCGKNANTAAVLKEKGNKEFVKNDNKVALKFYSESILNTPHDADSLNALAVTMANRSAALYHLNEYELAISDINYVLSLPYPKELRYKVLERKAKCLLALKKHHEALQEFRNTLQALDDCKLPMEKKMKMQTDVQIMLGIMSKPKTKLGHINAFVEGRNKKKNEECRPVLCSGRNEIYDSGCDKFEILENRELGRYGSATALIKPGDTLVIEKPFCTVLLAEYRLTHCQNCFKRTIAPYPCRNCNAVIFCSIECKHCAEQTYHKYECKVLNTLYKSGASVTVLMALRIVTQKSLRFFLELKDRLQEPRNGVMKYQSSDYLSVYHLIRHEDKRCSSDFFERTVMTLFLLQCLQKVDYFRKSTTQEQDKLSEDEYFIAGLMLRHLQLLQFNAHEISELEIVSTEHLEQSTSLFIGGGLFPTLALFNHSCDPGVVRYFQGTTVIVRAIKTITPGEILAENYGPMFTLSKRDERHRKLKSQYWFDCFCIPCVEDWPVFKEMDKKIMRFRCDARQDDGGKVNSCKNAIAVPVDTDQFMVPCRLCGQHTNVLKGLKTLQDTDAMFRQASRDTDRGNYQAALAIYLEILTLLDSVLVPPFPDYHLCQQAIRKCMLSLGNRYVKDVL